MVSSIKQVKDSYGFDICSFDNSGSPIKIEVKTTTFGSDEPFYMTKNEKLVAEDRRDESYIIYRIYNIDVSQTPDYYNMQIIDLKT